MGSKKSETKQTNEPPKWAAPLFKQAAGDAQSLYNNRIGYNTYTGPTQAPLSDQTLGGMNNALAATGFTGSPVTNQSINSQIPDVFSIMQQALANKPKPQAAPSNPMADAVWMPGNELSQGRYVKRLTDSDGNPLSDEETIQRTISTERMKNRGGNR